MIYSQKFLTRQECKFRINLYPLVSKLTDTFAKIHSPRITIKRFANLNLPNVRSDHPIVVGIDEMKSMMKLG